MALRTPKWLLCFSPPMRPLVVCGLAYKLAVGIMLAGHYLGAW